MNIQSVSTVLRRAIRYFESTDDSGPIDEKMARVGSGERFAALAKKIAARGDVRDPKAVAAAIGRRKYGKERFQKMAVAGKKKK